MHPILREPRTGCLLSTYGSKYHVQFHNSELGVFVLRDIEITPIGLNDLYRHDHEIFKQHIQFNNKMLSSQDMPEPMAPSLLSANDMRNTQLR